MQAQTQSNATALPLDDLHAIEDFAKQYSKLLSLQTLRWQLRSRDTNGLSSCCVKVGKKLLISKTRYEQWLGNQAGRAAA